LGFGFADFGVATRDVEIGDQHCKGLAVAGLSLPQLRDSAAVVGGAGQMVATDALHAQDAAVGQDALGGRQCSVSSGDPAATAGVPQ
jgi:hypothetical protein